MLAGRNDEHLAAGLTCGPLSKTSRPKISINPFSVFLKPLNLLT